WMALRARCAAVDERGHVRGPLPAVEQLGRARAAGPAACAGRRARRPGDRRPRRRPHAPAHGAARSDLPRVLHARRPPGRPAAVGPAEHAPLLIARAANADRGGVGDAFDSTAWEHWYRLARETLACGHEEAVEYANLRVVEEQNRASLRGEGETERGG